MELCQVYLNNKGVMSRRYLIKWDELNRTHHGKVWIKTSSDWRSHSECQKHLFLFKYYTWYNNIILIQMYSSSGSKLLNIIIISCSLIVMNASSFLEYCGSLQESNGWPLWPRRDHWWRPLCRGQAGKACFHWRKSCGQGKK